MRLRHHPTTKIRFPLLVVGNSFASHPHICHKPCRNAVDHCKVALHTTYHLLWRALGFATWLKTIQSAYMPGQTTSCQPQRTLNRRCSVRTSSTNSAKVLACPRKPMQRCSLTHTDISIFADVPTGWLSGDSADDILVSIPWNKSLGWLGCKAQKLQFRYSFVLRFSSPSSINLVSTAKKTPICVLFRLCDERVFSAILHISSLFARLIMARSCCLPHDFCMFPFSVFSFLYVFPFCSLFSSRSDSVSVHPSLEPKSGGPAPIKN